MVGQSAAEASRRDRRADGCHHLRSLRHVNITSRLHFPFSALTRSPFHSDLSGTKSPRGPPRCLEFTLILLAESLDVRFPVRIEEFLAALLPRGLEFGRCDVPVWPAFLGNGTKVLAEIFHSGPAEVPVAVVDLIDDETRLEDNHMRDHRIVDPYTPRCRDLFGRYASCRRGRASERRHRCDIHSSQ